MISGGRELCPWGAGIAELCRYNLCHSVLDEQNLKDRLHSYEGKLTDRSGTAIILLQRRIILDGRATLFFIWRANNSGAKKHSVGIGNLT